MHEENDVNIGSGPLDNFDEGFDVDGGGWGGGRGGRGGAAV
jgi:hypothetical protein